MSKCVGTTLFVSHISTPFMVIKYFLSLMKGHVTCKGVEGIHKERWHGGKTVLWNLKWITHAAFMLFQVWISAPPVLWLHPILCFPTSWWTHSVFQHGKSWLPACLPDSPALFPDVFSFTGTRSIDYSYVDLPDKHMIPFSLWHSVLECGV